MPGVFFYSVKISVGTLLPLAKIKSPCFARSGVPLQRELEPPPPCYINKAWEGGEAMVPSLPCRDGLTR